MQITIKDKKDIRLLLDELNYWNTNGKDWFVELEWYHVPTKLYDKFVKFNCEDIEEDLSVFVLQRLGFHSAPEGDNDYFHYLYIAVENIILGLKGSNHKIIAHIN